MAGANTTNGRPGFWRRQWHWLRFVAVLLCGFVLSMGTGFLAVRLLAGDAQGVSAPDSALVVQGDRLRMLAADLAELADALGGRIHPESGAPRPEDVRWLTQEFRPRVNYFRIQLSDPHMAGALPAELREHFRGAAGLLAEAAARPEHAEKRAQALAAVRRAAQAVEGWVQETGVTPYLRMPARFPHY